MSGIKDISQTHPTYAKSKLDWDLMADCYDGERQIKAKGALYLPPTSGQRALGLGNQGDRNNRPKSKAGQELYDAYVLRANFPELVQDTTEDLVGLLNQEPATIKLPKELEPMRDNATDQGEPLDVLLGRIQEHQLLFGRHGLGLDVDESRNLPYIVDYAAPQIINWDDEAIANADGTRAAERKLTLTVLDESSDRRDGFRWKFVNQYRALELNEAGQFSVVVNDDGQTRPAIVPSIQGTPLDFIPFTFINTMDLVPTIGQIPLIGLARIALTIYRGDADYRQALFMQGQDTLVIIGEDVDEDDGAGVVIGSGAVINLPGSKTEADAKFIGAESSGIADMRHAKEDDYGRAAEYGLKLMSPGAGAVAAETMKIRVAARTAPLGTIAKTSAAGLEQQLKFAALWVGANPDEVSVEANTDFIKERMQAAELLGFLTAKDRGAPLSQRTIHRLMRSGDVTNLEYEAEQEEIDEELTSDDNSSLAGVDDIEPEAEIDNEN